MGGGGRRLPEAQSWLHFLFAFQVWLDHINGTVHADGQLKLLQQ